MATRQCTETKGTIRTKGPDRPAQICLVKLVIFSEAILNPLSCGSLGSESEMIFRLELPVSLTESQLLVFICWIKFFANSLVPSAVKCNPPAFRFLHLMLEL